MTNKDFQNTIAILISIAIVCFIIFFNFKKRNKRNEKRTKNDLARYYTISKPTLANWIKHFHPEISPFEWKSKRFLTSEEYENILNFFGKDKTLVLNKKGIFIACESDYKILTGSVKSHLKKIGITEDIWKKCSVFPPRITQQIFVAMNGEDKDTRSATNSL